MLCGTIESGNVIGTLLFEPRRKTCEAQQCLSKGLANVWFGGCLGLALARSRNSSFLLAVAMEIYFKLCIGFSRQSSQSCSNRREQNAKNVN
jgi:hypothetical protein